MDTTDLSVWAVRECNKEIDNRSTDTLNSPFESFSPRRRRASSRQSAAAEENDGGETSPPVVSYRHDAKLSGRPTTASHPKSTTAFRQLSDLLWQAQLNSVARRNERERKRVKLVNNGFAALRQKIPSCSKQKVDFSPKSSRASKLSKVETLRSAIKYINQLQYLLKECTPNRDAIANEDACSYSTDPFSDNESAVSHTDCSMFSDHVPKESVNSETYCSKVDGNACSIKSSSFDERQFSSDFTMCPGAAVCPDYNAMNNYQPYTNVNSNEYYNSW